MQTKVRVTMSRGLRAASIDENNHLIFELTDGTVLDLGCVGGDMSATIYDPQGKVQDVFAYSENAVNNHASNAGIHVTAAEKEEWNNKSDFSGRYDDLIDKPDETDPTVPSWAKKPNKPSYTAAEVGATPAYTFGTTDLVDGVSELPTGALYFVVGPGEIKFYINGTEYAAIDGMTWAEWTNTAYNTSEIWYSESMGDLNPYVYDDNGVYVSGWDAIVANHQYTTG